MHVPRLNHLITFFIFSSIFVSSMVWSLQSCLGISSSICLVEPRVFDWKKPSTSGRDFLSFWQGIGKFLRMSWRKPQHRWTTSITTMMMSLGITWNQIQMHKFCLLGAFMFTLMVRSYFRILCLLLLNLIAYCLINYIFFLTLLWI